MSSIVSEFLCRSKEIAVDIQRQLLTKVEHRLLVDACRTWVPDYLPAYMQIWPTPDVIGRKIYEKRFAESFETMQGTHAEYFVSALADAGKELGLLQFDIMTKLDPGGKDTGCRDYLLVHGEMKFLLELTQKRNSKPHGTKQYMDLGTIPKEDRYTLLIADDPAWLSKDHRVFGRHVGGKFLFGVQEAFDDWVILDPEIRAAIRRLYEEQQPWTVHQIIKGLKDRGLV